MYTKDELNLKLVSELRLLAGELGISDAGSFSKKELIYKIIDHEATKEGGPEEAAASPEPARRGRKPRITAVSEAEPTLFNNLPASYVTPAATPAPDMEADVAAPG